MPSGFESLFLRYNHVVTNEPLGIQIKAKAPEPTSQLAGYVLAGFIGVVGLFVAFIGLRKIGLAIILAAILVAANTWKRGQSSNIRKVFSVLIGAEDVTLSQGFRTERIRRDDVADIKIRMRAVDGQKEAQMFFVDATGRQYESLTFFGLSGSGLKESAEKMSDHIWNFIKTNKEEHRELGPLDLPGASQGENEERPPWG